MTIKRFATKLLFPLLIIGFFLIVRYMLGYVPSGYVLRDALSGFAITVIVLALFRGWGVAVYLGLWALLALAYGAVGMTYGLPDANAIAALINTNPEEASEFFALLPTRVYLFYGVLVFWCALLWLYARAGGGTSVLTPSAPSPGLLLQSCSSF